MVWDRSKNAIPILEDLVDKYPEIVQFRNYLAMAYSGVRDHENSRKVIIQLHQDEPDYLFGKLNYAELCLSDGDIGKVPEIFGGHYDLHALYPDRDEFHISEVMSFFAIMCRYFIAKGESDKAGSYFKIMQDIDPDHRITKVVEKEMSPGLFSKFIQKVSSNKNI
jgi:hypothetical protein